MGEPGQTDLAIRAQGGDADAVGQLYDQHHEALFRYIWARVGERTLAEDLTGEVFLRMLKALPRYRPTAAPFRAWLYQIARNLLVDHYRKAALHSMAPLHEAETIKTEADDVTGLVEQQLTLERVHQALARLTETQREVMTLRFLSGLSLQEVAAMLGKTENSVKALQHRGLLALREMLTRQSATIADGSEYGT